MADKTVVIDKYSLVNSVAQVTDILLPAAASLAGKFFYLSTVSGKFYVWYTVDGSGPDPRPAHDMTGIAVALAAGDTGGGGGNENGCGDRCFRIHL